MSDNPHLDAAKDSLNRLPGDPKSRWIEPRRVQDSYDDLRRAWVRDFGEQPGGGSGPPPGAHYVTTYGAVGDGVTDDTDAILDAVEAAGEGGYVFFPDGVYVISRPIVPKSGQRLEGTYQNKYEAAVHPSRPLDGRQGTVIAASPDFVGEGMVMCVPYVFGVHLTRLALVGPGPGHSSGCHGVTMPTRDDNVGETAWWIEECLINSMPGHGVTGHMWVFDMRDTHISQCSWALAVTGDDGMLDTRIIGSMFYFNRDGGLILDGGHTGAVEIIGCRVERSGNLYGYPATPTNPNAPGVLIGRGQQIILTNVSTDANTGPGLWLGHPTKMVYNILVANCAWARDGGGTQQVKEWWDWVTPPGGGPMVYEQVPDGTPGADVINGEGIPGVWLDRCFHVKMSNNVVGFGKHDDSGAEGPIGPTYGLQMNDTSHCEVLSSRIEVLPFERSLNVDDTNTNTNLYLPSHQLMKVPVAGEAQWLPTTKQIGLIAYQNDLQTLAVQNYNGDWRYMLSYDPRYSMRMPKSVDLYSDSGDGDSAIRIIKGGPDAVDGYGLLRWTMGSNSATYNHTWSLNRFGDDGLGDLEAYLDSPISVRRDNGTVETNQLFTRPVDETRAAAQFRGRPGQTGQIVSFETDDGTAVAGVTADGRMWGQPGTSSDDFVTKAQFDAGGGGSGGGEFTGGDVGYLNIVGTAAADKPVGFYSDLTKLWQMGVNPSGTFYVWRTDATGTYLDSPLTIDRATGRVTTKHILITPGATDVTPLAISAPLGQTSQLATFGVDGVAKAGVLPDGKVWGAAGTAPEHFVTKAQLDAAGGGGGQTWTNTIALNGLATQSAYLEFKSGGVKTWEFGVNPDASGNAFSIGRYVAGAYVDTPLGISKSNGLITQGYTFMRALSATQVPLTVRSAVGNTASMFRVEDSAGTSKLHVMWDGTIRLAWGSTAFGAVQQGCTQIVRQGATGGNTMLAVYTTTDNATNDISVFEVYGDGSVKIGNATASNEALALGQLKSVVAASTDFADFKARVAAL